MTNNDDPKNTIGRAEDRQTENPVVGVESGYEVSLAIRRDPPGSKYPDDFAVNLYIAQSNGENIDIARVDTSRIGCHIDRPYLPDGDPNQQHDKRFLTDRPEGAVAYMIEDDRWRDWVQKYDQNHGLP